MLYSHGFCHVEGIFLFIVYSRFLGSNLVRIEGIKWIRTFVGPRKKGIKRVVGVED